MAPQRTPEQLKSIILKATQHLVAVGGYAEFQLPKVGGGNRNQCTDGV